MRKIGIGILVGVSALATASFAQTAPTEVKVQRPRGGVTTARTKGELKISGQEIKIGKKVSARSHKHAPAVKSDKTYKRVR